MSSGGFAHLTSRLVAAADRHAEGRLVMITEGGYELSALAECLRDVVAVLAGREAPQPARTESGRASRAIAAVRAVHAARWRGL
jgi:acetoin utilization deacetylase AcuC-like enzyme